VIITSTARFKLAVVDCSACLAITRVVCVTGTGVLSRTCHDALCVAGARGLASRAAAILGTVVDCKTCLPGATVANIASAGVGARPRDGALSMLITTTTICRLAVVDSQAVFALGSITSVARTLASIGSRGFTLRVPVATSCSGKTGVGALEANIDRFAHGTVARVNGELGSVS
jgi:hypothetical protein